MKKVLLGAVLAASVAMAGTTTNDDLLSQATLGKASGAEFEMSKEQMKDADGGYAFSYNFQTRQWQRTNNSLAYGGNRRFKTYSNTSYRGSGTQYQRRYNNGSTYSWVSRNYGGYSWMAY